MPTKQGIALTWQLHWQFSNKQNLTFTSQIHYLGYLLLQNDASHTPQKHDAIKFGKRLKEHLKVLPPMYNHCNNTGNATTDSV